ncbi:rod shape-determining protein MreD [uncultured Barnesiella sp.]|uniref:rod shape-determining protein MreD n=1 Tax=uncultured Barnesiella sp. TaxID=584861 RepID=UPI0026210060|nr:rod shape-determining protein MreD [uncultured Barnesiella sp.]
MSKWLRYLFLFIVMVLLQVTIGNDIHLFGVAIPFFYIYFILRLPLSLSINWTLTLAFVLGLTIDIFSNTPGMNALACVVMAALRKPVLNLYTPRGEDYAEAIPSIRSFGMSLYVRYLLTLSLCFCVVLFLVESLSLLNVGRLILRVVASTALTFLVVLGMDSLTKTGREKRL